MLPVLVVLDFTLALDAHAHDVRRDIRVIIMDYALAGFERMLLAVVLTMDGWMDGELGKLPLVFFLISTQPSVPRSISFICHSVVLQTVWGSLVSSLLLLYLLAFLGLR
jgi:hypothetical protein